MSEKREYQDKMLKSKKEIVICNWERGDGKTYSIFKKIIKEKNGRFLYISPFVCMDFVSYFKEYGNENKHLIKELNLSMDIIRIKYKDNNIIELYCKKPNNVPRGLRNMDLVFCDEYYPDKEYIDSIFKPIGIKQIYIMMTNDNTEYIDSRKYKNEFSIKEFYNTQIKELMIEYSEIHKDKTTTLTRENILKQIKVLQDMARSN